MVRARGAETPADGLTTGRANGVMVGLVFLTLGRFASG